MSFQSVYISPFCFKKPLPLKLPAFYFTRLTPWTRTWPRRYPHLQPLFFLKKNPKNKAYSLYDLRYVQTASGLYPLPLYPVNIARFLQKSQNLPGEHLLFPQRPCLFYFEGDSTGRLQNPLFLQSIEQRAQYTRPSFKQSIQHMFLQLYSLLQKKLDPPRS